ncbi:hypothetical protein LVJ94_12990 [Pendulispora rubella]|uniref:Uncharacterized protein n=1 Tax=Pendulispora rubella TaxID=2741070 RepID=A0ABZ2LG38_9BACT
MSRHRRWGLVGFGFLVLLMVAGLTAACQACGKSDAAPDAAASIEPPVPAPDGLLAEAVVIDPNASWGKVQRGTGGALALMPMTLGGLLTSLASLDPGLGPEIDGTAPAFGVLAAGPSGPEGPLSYAMAVRLLDERRTRGTLFEGQNPRYAPHDAAGFTVLGAKAGAAATPAMPAAVAVARGGFLVVARTEADLTRLGPYVTRTLPAKPPPSGSIAIDVPRAAFTGPFGPYLTSLWSQFRTDMEQKDARMREAHGGKAPDFGDPRAIVEMSDAFVKGKLGILGDLERAHFVVDPSEEGLRIAGTFTPASPDGPAAQTVRAMHAGDATPLLDVPKASATALLLRSDAKERQEGAHDATGAVVKALGDRIDADGRDKLERALADWSKGRGDVLSVAWVGSGLLLRAPATDAESASRAVRGLVALADKPAFKGPLETFLQVRQVTTSQVDVPGLGKVEQALLTRAEPKDPKAKTAALPKKAGIAWTVHGGTSGAPQIEVAAAEDPAAVLREIAESSGKAGEDADFAGAVKRLGSDVSLALVLRRGAIDPARAGGGLALVVGWGRTGNDARLTIEASHAFARELIRRSGGF